ncbi:MAG: SurA N-terminal domain-containing protein [Bacteroidetes bacterium]|nr:SurA N-terminal domain-containing protein [Bacteroidota bacterium]
MQLIQTIRDKGAAVVIAVIALSLIGFLLMDAKSGNKGAGGFFNSLSSNVGKVDGDPIEKADFDKRVNDAYDMAKQNGNNNVDYNTIREQVWNQAVAEKIFYKEADKLGIDYTSKELSAFLASDEPGNPLLQQPDMVDPATGKLDPVKVAAAISNMKKAKDKQKEAIETQIIEPQKLGSTSQKYFSLLNAAAYYPTWMKERDSANTKSFANISYVNIPFNVISDSTIKVSDDEINDYVAKHKGLFKQEAGRVISYVAFSQKPNGKDTALAMEQVAAQKEKLAADSSPAAFLARNGSSKQFDKDFVWKSKMKGTYKDSIIALPKGGVFGPYLEDGSYNIAKVTDIKQLADSVKCRHILIKIADLKNGQLDKEIRPDSVAKKLIDSIAAAIKGGADFNEMVLKYSDDPGSKGTKGEYNFNYNNNLVDSFYRTVFYEPAGTKKVVLGVDRNNYVGYHYIEVMEQYKFEPAYQVAYYSKDITASPATIAASNLEATKLSAQKNGKEFDAYIAKNGLQKISWPAALKENDFSIGQLPGARSVVKWAFDADPGDVSEVFNIEDQFIVATLDKIQKEGVQDAKTARASVDGVIRQNKKSDIIIKNLGDNPTFEKATSTYKQEVKTAGADSSIVFGSNFIKDFGDEPRVVGAAFNKENQTKVSAPIQGNSGVVLVKVNSIGTKPADTPEAAASIITQKKASLRNQVSAGWFDGLKNQATIKDNRSKYY